jgi:spore coat polysaccharide biosynthesis predicted glycosyltransferase SpsG|tara:strand:+ start:531 stop:893 length:363 start_codon:yes stop_codon:yes gene_type:complete
MTNIVQYQQGDVIFTKINNLNNNYIKNTVDEQGSKLIIAEGEATGHHHRFELKDEVNANVNITAYTRSWSNDPVALSILGGSATIIHEEHNPLTIPEGNYEVSFVREMDHVSRVTRRVID